MTEPQLGQNMAAHLRRQEPGNKSTKEQTQGAVERTSRHYSALADVSTPTL